MSIYACDQCGIDECFFPEVMLAVNTTDPDFPYHENEFELKFNEFREVFQSNESYKKFYQWLGMEKMKWFCSKKCAIDYLLNNKGKEINHEIPR